MIKSTEWDREQIKRGNWEVFLRVIREADYLLTKRCKMEKEDIRHIQGQAHYSDELCKLLGIGED